MAVGPRATPKRVMTFWTHKSVLEGKEATGFLADFASAKIARQVGSAYAAELHGALLSIDCSVDIDKLYEQILHGTSARVYVYRPGDLRKPKAHVTDNKGLFDAVQNEKPKKGQNEKRQAAWYQVLYDELQDQNVKVFWVNNNYMTADGLTKLSTAGARVDLVIELIQKCKLRITYCTQSGRRELHELKELKAQAPLRKQYWTGAERI